MIVFYGLVKKMGITIFTITIKTENLLIKLQREIGRLQHFMAIIPKLKRFIINQLRVVLLKEEFMQSDFQEKRNEYFSLLKDLMGLYLVVIIIFIYTHTQMN